MLNISTTANIFKIVLFFLYIFVFIKSPRTIMTKIKNTGCHNTSLHNENPCSIGARTLLLNEVSGVGRFLYKTQDILTYPHISGFTVTHSRGFSPHSSLPFPAESCISYLFPVDFSTPISKNQVFNMHKKSGTHKFFSYKYPIWCG